MSLEREQLNKLRSLIEEGISRTSVYIYINDLAGRFLYVSPSAARAFGMSPEMIVGRTGRELGLPEEMVRVVEGRMERAIEDGTPVHGEVDAWFEGRTLTLENDAALLHNEEGEPYAMMALVTDRTDARRAHVPFENGREMHRVSIEDDGPGIPDDMKARVFLRQMRNPRTSQGSGLGLYLVRKLVEDRVPGDHTKGARFVVLLPATVPVSKKE